MSSERSRHVRLGSLLASAALAIAPAPAAAITLFDAIRIAYQTNPDLRGQRAELRAVGEGYVQAEAGLGPQINLNGNGGYSIARVESGASLLGGTTTTTYRGSTGTGNISLVQPIFTFGALTAQLRSAKSTMLSGREALRQTEAEVLGKVITAYVDVRRDRAVLDILKDEIGNLSREFDETRERGITGQLSRTDVAEAEARFLQAQADLELAQGRLGASEAAFLSVVGEAPGDLKPEPELAGLPRSPGDAIDAAEGNNPQIRGAVHDEIAAREKVNAAKAAFGPTVSLRVDAGIQPTAPFVPDLYDRNVTVAGVVSLPLFSAGMRSSKVREARYRDDGAALKIEAVRRSIVQNILQAWSQMTAINAAMRHAQQEVDVYRLAVEGNQVEQRVGRRSIFELVNTENELANARIQLLQDGHDQYLAKAALLAAMGMLEAASLTPGLETYDPARTVTKASHDATLPWEPVVAALDAMVSSKTPAPSMSPIATTHTPSTAAPPPSKEPR